jgi:hypothetical protein
MAKDERERENRKRGKEREEGRRREPWVLSVPLCISV